MSLHPIKSKRKPKANRGYGRLLVEHGWDTGEKKSWTPGRYSKILILSITLLAVILVPSYAYYQNIYVPSNSGSSRPDPFTTLWNGQANTTGGGGQSGPIVFKSSVNATKDSTLSPGTLVMPAITIFAKSDAIIVGVIDEESCTLAITDTQSNSFTLLASTGNSNALRSLYETAAASASGSDTVTLNYSGTCLGGAGFFIVVMATVSDYTGVSGSFGASGTDINLSGPVNGIGTSNITLTTTSTSFILELFHFSPSESAQCGTVLNNSGQTDRNVSCKGFDRNKSTDITGKSGSNLFQFGFNQGGLAGGGPTSWTHSALELLAGTGPKPICISGYQCQNVGTANNDITTNPNATFPGMLLTNSSVDLSTGADKAIAFSFLFIGSIQNKAEFGWFLTLNGTLANSAKYSPTNDTSVALAVVQVWTSNSQYDDYVYLQRNLGQKVFTGSEDPFPACPQSYSIFLCVRSTHGANSGTLALVLNFTGGASGDTTPAGHGQSYLCIDFGVGATTCNLGGANNVAFSVGQTNFAVNYTQPWLNLQNNYHVGIWDAAGGPIIEWATRQRAAIAPSPIISIYSPPSTNPDITQSGFFGWIGRALGGAWNAVAGSLGPITTPLFGLGNSMLAVFSSAIIQAGNLLILGLLTLEGMMVAAMNAVGNGLGWGPLGTDFQNLINTVVSFFSSTFGPNFAFLGNAFTLVANGGTIIVAWMNSVISFTLSGLSWAASAITFVGTILFWLFEGISGLYATIFVLLWFIDLGDYGAEGGIMWFDTTRWLFFGAISFIIRIINLGLDLGTYLIGSIPKPLIQMIAHAVPRLPIIEVSGRPSFPEGHMQAARDGNMFTMIGWIVGMFFFVAFEGSTLPGSIAAFVPGAATSTAQLNGLLPLMEVTLMLLGTTLMFIFPAKLANAIPSLFERQVLPGSNIPLSLRAAPAPRGHSSVHFKKAQKRFEKREQHQEQILEAEHQELKLG